MKRVYNLDSASPATKNAKRLPYPGRYYAIIYDFDTRLIQPLTQDEEFCLVVKYKLLNAETFDLFDFVETYSLYKGNPRIEDFEAFLARYGYDLTSDDAVVGVTAEVDVVNEYIGGYMHPVISFRRWGIDKALQAYGDETRPIY